MIAVFAVLAGIFLAISIGIRAFNVMLQNIIGKIPGLKELQKVLDGVGKFFGSIGK
jgi:hypothetical protein